MMNDTKEQSIRLFVESPKGVRFECDIPVTTTLRQLCIKFFEYMGWPIEDCEGRGLRGVVELVDPDEPENTKRLSSDQTVEEAGLWDGAVLRIFPESIAGGSVVAVEQIGEGAIAHGAFAVTASDASVAVGGSARDITNAHIESNMIEDIQIRSEFGQTAFRYSDVSFPSHTIVQQAEALRVAITIEPTSEQSAELALEPPSDEEEPMMVDAYSVVSPLDFDLESPSV
jgi:hypothetical protein